MPKALAKDPATLRRAVATFSSPWGCTPQGHLICAPEKGPTAMARRGHRQPSPSSVPRSASCPGAASNSVRDGPPAITQTSIAGVQLGRMPSYYKDLRGGWQARVLSEPGFPPSPCLRLTRRKSPCTSRSRTASPHHHYLEPGLSDGSRDRPVLDGRGDEEGLRGRRPTLVERHLTRREEGVPMGRRQQPHFRDL